MEEEDWSLEIKKELKKSCIYAIGFFWKLYESSEGWFIRCQNINDIEKSLWVKVRVAGNKPYTLEDICFDFYCSDAEDINKFEMLYETQRWHKWLCEILLGKYETEMRKSYKKWVIHDDEILQTLVKQRLYGEPLKDLSIDMDNPPKEIEDIMARAYMGMLGFFWEMHENKGIWFIRIQNIYDVGKDLWVKVRVLTGNLTIDSLCFDFYKSNMSEEEKYKVLYLTERNKKIFCRVFLYKFSPDNEEKSDYKKWVIQDEVLTE